MEYRTIEHTDGRYLINEEGVVIDLKPQRNQKYNFWNEELPRELECNGRNVQIVYKGKRQIRALNTLVKSTFPELFITNKEKEEVKRGMEGKEHITFTVEEFNHLIYPNKVRQLYDKTFNMQGHLDPKDKRKHLWQPPTKVNITNGKIRLYKGHTYFGYGLTHLIHFDGLMPYNGKSFEQCVSKDYMRRYNAERERKQIHNCELWND